MPSYVKGSASFAGIRRLIVLKESLDNPLWFKPMTLESTHERREAKKTCPLGTTYHGHVFLSSTSIVTSAI
jgi:hypothetical protein